jgi:hypothetical protein
MNDNDLPPLDADVRTLVERTRGVPPAPEGARERVLAGVDAAVDSRSGGGPAASARHVPGPPLAGGKVATLAATFALGCAVGALVTKALGPGAKPAPPPERVVLVERPAPEPVPPPDSPAPLASALVADGPAPPRSGSSAKMAAPVLDPLLEERALLDGARAALERGEPEAALAATARHERRFPNGILAQEREAIAVRALLALGRAGAARTRADRFRARYPNSVLLPAIASAVGEAPGP